MNAWEAIFTQSPVNNGFYEENELAQGYWEWPRRTWLQDRLEYVRENELTTGLKSIGKLRGARKTRLN
jgi:hypothetical protein